MEVFEAISTRKSIRKYKNNEVEDEKLERILESARLAPSAKNKQKWKFLVVKNDKTRLKLAEAAYNQKFVEEAPVTIVACATNSEYIMPCGQYAYTVDVSIAVSFMILEATELGLGTCWLGAFNENTVKEILDIPEYIRVVAMFTLGYAAEEGSIKTSRKNIEDVVCFEKYE
ncbi:nitroreductase family protein [Methanobacterium alcaliphilum]|uniref:nitroreductase family protein n=1 Tax=Methanobacterium alcaliphilum TaxID=392018 RepID=UPI00200B2FF4|nr:nitroreductase family protein [Methanobacterium alcaliphilum]MCK9152559.1 nitroreductase family protein [Methanobacterium alcaliphilum]